MSLRSKIIHFWENSICEGVNRKALKRILRANRLWHSQNRFLQFSAMMIHNSNVKKYGCEIYPQATIGEGLYIPHAVGIVVGSTTVLGKNCTLYPNVVFGAKCAPNAPKPKGRRHAIVGDNCVFGANSSIIGNITIGDNVIVGAGAVITQDIPSNSVVVGVNQIVKKLPPLEGAPQEPSPRSCD